MVADEGAGVVDQDVEPVVACQELLGVAAHVVEVGQVGHADLDVGVAACRDDPLAGGVGAADVTAQEADRGAQRGQPGGGREAEPGGGAGDDGDAPAIVPRSGRSLGQVVPLEQAAADLVADPREAEGDRGLEGGQIDRFREYRDGRFMVSPGGWPGDGSGWHRRPAR